MDNILVVRNLIFLLLFIRNLLIPVIHSQLHLYMDMISNVGYLLLTMYIFVFYQEHLSKDTSFDVKFWL
jgi:hypothetical protein